MHQIEEPVSADFHWVTSRRTVRASAGHPEA
jgi:hypothetical protein